MVAAPGPLRGPEASQRRRGLLWVWLPVALLSLSFLGAITTAAIAVSDPSFAVEPDYYQKALNWDEHQAALERSARLGWKATLRIGAGVVGSEVVVELRDRSGGPVDGASVRLEAFHNARRAHVVAARMQPAGGGAYRAEMPLRRAGLWEFRLEARRSGDRFLHTARQDVELHALAGRRSGASQ